MKKIISVVLVAIMLFALVGCSGKEMQEKLAELEAKLQEQSSKIDELEEEKDNLLGQITQLQGEIGGLQGEVERLEEERENDYNQLCALSSNLYTLQEAYDKGLITKEDLKAICYFRCYGFVYERVDYDKPLSESEAIEKIDYEPSFELGELDKVTERKIKGAVTYWWKTDEEVRCEYYGTYNYGQFSKCIAVEIEIGIGDTPQGEKYLEIDGIVFRYTGALPRIWVENDY